MDVNAFEQNFSVLFNNKKLLIQAFTHSSYANEHRDQQLVDNERLEFLGDAVLELGVSQFLYKQYKHMREGELTKLRASIVCEESLYQFSTMLQFNQYILLGKGEERTGGRNRQALLADIFEAFLGALYLDQGIEACLQFLEQYIFPTITHDAFSHMMDYKTKLQELIQKDRRAKLSYHVIREKGPSHNREFIVEVSVNNDVKEEGVGRSKKEAEQHAAKKMLDRLNL